MIRRTYLLIFAILLIFPLTAKDTLLNSNDVRKVMDQLFDYHIDRTEINTDVVKRSLKIYLTHFDGGCAYLASDEVKPYLNPSEHLAQTVIREYQSDRYTTYFALNRTIEQSIIRAREWRAYWEEDPAKLVREAQKIKLDAPQSESKFISSRKELRNRHYQRFLRLIALHMDELKYSSYDGVEAKLVGLCEKQLTVSENRYLGIDEEGRYVSEQEKEHHIVLRTLKALAYSLDAHTAYFSPEEAYAMKVQLEKGMCGIGVVLREGIDGITIHEILKGGPADSCGKLQAGDTIVEVDGKPIQEASFHHVLEIMRGKEGTRMSLGIVRKGDDSFHVDLKRKKIAIEDKRVDISSEPFGDGLIGKITLHSFYEGEDGVSSERDLKAAIAKLRKEGQLHGLVLDMRDNSGGFLSQAIKVSGLFISNGVVVISKYSDGSTKYYRVVDGERYFDGPLVILVSKGSASATEIVAQTLQDYGVAVVVGDEQTYGKGTIQHQTVTDDSTNSFFKVTVGRYYTVSGKSTQIEGVKSDIVVPSELHFAPMGEKHLDYPLPADRVAPAFDDSLADVDPFARKWFTKYYTPALQKREVTWVEAMPKLKANSEKRVARNKNFQVFLKQIKDHKERPTCGENDLGMEESVNIVKDMIFFQNH